MTTKQHDKLVMEDVNYRALYMKYIGCLRVMADAAVYLNGNENAEEFDMAFDDAESAYPHLRIKRIINGRELVIGL